MISTPDLIDVLAANAAPVRRLRPPLMRATLWLLLAVFVLVLIGIGLGVRPDMAQKARDWFFVVGMAASLLTGALAAIAAFMVSLPDRSRFWLVLPAPVLVVWLSTIGYGCLTAWVGLGAEGVRLGDLAECFATLALTSVPVSAVMLLMLRRAAPLRPAAAAMMGSLAVGGITATGLLVFHPLDATIMILAWTIGIAALFVGLGGAFGRRMLARPAPHGRN